MSHLEDPGSLLDPGAITSLDLKPWQVQLINRIARMPPGSRFIILMPPRQGRP